MLKVPNCSCGKRCYMRDTGDIFQFNCVLGRCAYADYVKKTPEAFRLYGDEIRRKWRRMKWWPVLFILECLAIVILGPAPAVLAGLYAPNWLLGLITGALAYPSFKLDLHKSFVTWGLTLFNFTLIAATLLTRLLFL